MMHPPRWAWGSCRLPCTRHPKTCFVVGLGTGETAGWLGKIPSVERVDAVEIEPALDELVRRCASVNGDVFHNRKIHVIYNDAREVLLTNRQTYDIIASEPSNPYRAGIANLFTREFYEAVSGRLNEGGLFVQWLQAYETDETTVFTVFATLKSVFKHVEIWQSKHDDMLLLCSNQPFSYTAEGLRRRIAEEPYRTALAAAWRATQMEGFLARYVAGQRLVEEASRNYARCLNTDDLNRVEYGFARTLGRPSGFSVAKLHQRAIALQSDRPACRLEGVDWEGVEDERTAMSVLAQRVPDIRDASASQAARIRAWTRYLAGDYTGMIWQWESQPRPARYPTETALLALAYAMRGHYRAESLAEQLQSYDPRESEMIEGIFLFQRGRGWEASRTLAKAFVGLRQDPWAVFDVTHKAIEVAAGLALRDAACARQLLPALQEPFAALYADEQRRVAAYLVASQVTPQDTVPLVESYEPNVPWELRFLELRADVYRKTRHRLAGRAQSDLALFLRNERRKQVVVQFSSSAPAIAAKRATAATTATIKMTSTTALAVAETSSQRSVPNSSATTTVSPNSERRLNWSGRRRLEGPSGSVTVCLYFAQSFNCSTAASTSLRRFSKTANMARIAAPKAMPQMYQIQVCCACAACEMMLTMSNTKNVNPRKRNDRTRNEIPANMPATESTISTRGSPQLFPSPAMNMSAVEEM